jgi:hypothetical protein
MTALRTYQSDVIGDYHAAIDRGQRRVIRVCPTGAGKTVIGASIIDSLVHNHINGSALVLAHRREIISLTSRKLHAAGVAHGIIQAGFPTRPSEPVQVASIQTLWTRAIRIGSMNLPPADLIVVDECHHAPAETYRKIIEAYPGAVLLGLTATPCRGDGRGLGVARKPATTLKANSPSGWIAKISSATLSRTGINTASAARRSLSPSRSSTRSISATNLSNPGCAPNTSMARRPSRNATPRWRG